MTHQTPGQNVFGQAHSTFRADKYADEDWVIEQLLNDVSLTHGQQQSIQAKAAAIVTASRLKGGDQGTLDAFLQEFGLSNDEGVALMCLAESLLRIPDADTADRLIAERISSGDWAGHRGKSRNLFVNASVWALMLTGEVIDLDPGTEKDPSGWMARLVNRSGEPVIRQAMKTAMRIMGQQFVLGRSIEEAIKTAGSDLVSFDMLGEGARSLKQADGFFESYKHAIDVIGSHGRGKPCQKRHAISVKLSALYPRYEEACRADVFAHLFPKLLDLVSAAAAKDLNFTIDAEEADRLTLSLDLFDALLQRPEFSHWEGLGLAVQAYQKRSPEVVDWVVERARQHRRRVMMRLVKGAYWDSEIKHCQVEGLPDYPVFTRKAGTDVAYARCAEKMLQASAEIYGQFATHNAVTVCTVLELAKSRTDFEFQRLHGMGDLLYKTGERVLDRDIPLRLYGPVGTHEELLPYLVRRLLENGANSSFVNRFMDQDVPVEQVATNPIAVMEAVDPKRHPAISLPQALYGASRANSKGLDLSDRETLLDLEVRTHTRLQQGPVDVRPIVNGDLKPGENAAPIAVPAQTRHSLGQVHSSTLSDIAAAYEGAAKAQPAWDALGGPTRADIADAAANQLEAQILDFLPILTLEAGKTFADGVAEVREAVDFLRYYAAQARAQFGRGAVLTGPTGESNHLALLGRGVFACISPWNFPLAIFMGQVSAALLAGNAVLAKPAEQTPLVAQKAVQLLHEAGVPQSVLQFLPGGGDAGAAIIAQPGLAGAAFTGSTDVAKAINLTLAQKDGPIVPLIAETGGQNAMIVDSTALLETVVDDVLASGFGSAGQRCSALRVLYVQSDIADKLMTLLSDAMDTIKVGNPAYAQSDVGPIIDDAARETLSAHVTAIETHGKIVKQARVPSGLCGTFFAPTLIEIDSLSALKREVFGPIVHILRFKSGTLPQVLSDIRSTGYGLTLGLHSRIQSMAGEVARQSGVGNVYVNRNMIGAVVGVQPFGGRGLSGTGPKAGGPHYLHQFATEQTVTVNTTATGGNADLFQQTA